MDLEAEQFVNSPSPRGGYLSLAQFVQRAGPGLKM